jgi:hypothetical protein
MGLKTKYKQMVEVLDFECACFLSARHSRLALAFWLAYTQASL